MLRNREVISHGDGQRPSATPTTWRGASGWLRALTALPITILPLLPSATCPVCLAAYAGVLSSLGLGALFDDRVQRPLIVLFLAITVGSISWATRYHRRPGPIVTVLAGGLAILAGRIVWTASWAVFLGVVCVVIAAGWNLLLKRPQRQQLVQIGGVP